MKLHTRYARYGDANIAYQTVGEGNLDLVFVPCWISHLERLWREPRFARFVERLSGFGRVILFDKRGTGMSDPAPATSFPSLEERMEDLNAVLDAAGSRRVVLVGAAIGGRLSALFAATHPERVAAVITMGSAARGSWAPDYPWAPTPEEHEQRFARLRQEWGGPVMVEEYASSLADDPAFCRWWAECLRSGASPAAAVAAERLSAESDIRHVLPNVKAPTLVLHRSGDRVVDVGAGRYLASQIPGARFVELPGGDHLPFVGDQVSQFAAIERFLADTLGTTATPRPEWTLATVLVANFPGNPGDRWEFAYRSLIHDEITRCQGRTAKVTADGLVAVFDAPARAVRCAEALATGMRRLGLRSGIGLHTGQVENADGNVGGPAVQLAKRIAANAHTGEILVSNMVVGLVAGSGLSFTHANDREATGLPADCRLFRLTGTSRTTTASAAKTDTILPTPASSLSPRERDVTALIARGQSNREIGFALAISVATVERHVANIMTKLGVRSRAHIAAWAAEQLRGRNLAPAAPIGTRYTALETVAFAAD